MLSDLIRPSLRIVFCGTAAGNVSASRGAYYAHPQNRFWTILHETGLTPVRLQPDDYARLVDFGIGLTDLAKHVAGMDRSIPKTAFDKQSVARVRTLIEAHAPNILAFTSIEAGKRFFGDRRDPGEQPERLGKTRLWVLPSTSSANGHWTPEPWFALARSLTAESSSLDPN